MLSIKFFFNHFTTESLNQQQENALKYQIAKAQISKAARENGTSFIEEAASGNAFQSLENTPAPASKFATPESGVPAEMPQGKPPGAPGGASATYGGSSSSASGQVIGGKAYPPSLPPVPKAKASPLVKPDSPWTVSPDKWPQSPQFDPYQWMANRVYGAVDAVTNFNITTPPQSWGSNSYQAPTPLSWNRQLELYREQQQRELERQQQNRERQASQASSMARQHLSDVSQQQQVFTTPKREKKGRGMNTPESQ